MPCVASFSVLLTSICPHCDWQLALPLPCCRSQHLRHPLPLLLPAHPRRPASELALIHRTNTPDAPLLTRVVHLYLLWPPAGVGCQCWHLAQHSPRILRARTHSPPRPPCTPPPLAHQSSARPLAHPHARERHSSSPHFAASSPAHHESTWQHFSVRNLRDSTCGGGGGCRPTCAVPAPAPPESSTSLGPRCGFPDAPAARPR